MKISDTPIDGLLIAEITPFQDERGCFSRLYCERELADAVGNRRVVQINNSCTMTPGAVRGMHYQSAPAAEMKMVRCLKGRVWDVAVDLRHGSPWFLQWHAQELSPENGLMMLIPEGFAHGFQVLEANSELLYLHTEPYTQSAEGGVRYDDPALAIDWPLQVADLSKRDRRHPLVTNKFHGLKL